MSTVDLRQRKSKWVWVGRIAFIPAVTALSWFTVPGAIIAICATILVAVHVRASELIEISFGPLRAKLKQEISEAERLVEKLREFAALQAKGVISANTRLGRWSDQSDWAYQSLREIEAALRELGVSEDEIRNSRMEMIKFTASDLGGAAMASSTVPSKLGREAVKEWQSIMHKGLEKTPEEIEAFLKKWNVLTPERQIRIDDMRWVLEHHDIRDRDQFMRGHEPVEWD